MTALGKLKEDSNIFPATLRIVIASQTCFPEIPEFINRST